MPWRTRTCHTWPYYDKLYVIFCQECVMKPVVIHESLSLLFYLGRGQGEEIATQPSFLPHLFLLDKLLLYQLPAQYWVP